MSVIDHVKGSARFVFFRGGYLYYKTDSGLEFPVPVEDAEGATFLSEDKAIFFMRWIRKHLKGLQDGTN